MKGKNSPAHSQPTILEVCEDTNPGRECFFLEAWAKEIQWMKTEDGIRLMPNLASKRFNYCPTCGAYIRNIKIPK